MAKSGQIHVTDGKELRNQVWKAKKGGNRAEATMLMKANALAKFPAHVSYAIDGRRVRRDWRRGRWSGLGSYAREATMLLNGKHLAAEGRRTGICIPMKHSMLAV